MLATRWMHDIVGEPEQVYVQNVDQLHAHDFIRMWLNLRPQNITQKVYTCTTQELWSGQGKSCCTQAGPAHAAGHAKMAWTDVSTFLHALPVALIAVARRDLSQVTGIGSQATMTNSVNRLPCDNLDCSRHWIGKSMSDLHPLLSPSRNWLVSFELIHYAKRAK